MNTKHLKIAKAGSRGDWGLRVEDGLGVTYAWVSISRTRVADLILQLNAASDQGAPWGKFEEVRQGLKAGR